MSIVRIGSNEKYADGWAAAFGKGTKRKKAAAKKAAPKKKSAKAKKKSKA